MSPRLRPVHLAVLVAVVAVAVPCGAWYVAGSRSASREAARLAEAPLRTAAETAERLAVRLAARLETLRETESGRPPSHYQHYFHDPATACDCAVLQISPLAAGPADPLVLAHFQVDSDCRVSFPDAEEEERAATAREGELLAILRAAAPAPSPDPALARASAPGPEQPLLMGPFEWRTIGEGREPLLAALREVTTTRSAYLQGFVIDLEAAESLLQGALLPARLLPGEPGAPDEAALALAGSAWRVRVDAAEAAARAAGDAARVRRRFLGVFAGGAAAAALAALSLVLVVWQADRLARQRVQFAAAAAHELRTPLAGLRLHGEMLAGGLGDPGRARDYARRVAEEAERLGRVVGNVLGYTRLERGGLTVRAESGDLAAAVCACLERLEPSVRGLGATLAVVVGEDLPHVLFDRDAVDQIVQNLVDNAGKYSREAGDRTIHVDLSRRDRRVELSVRDHGPGIPPAVRGRLFRPFVRGQKDGPAGLGLGLAVVRALAAAHGATVDVGDAEGGGTRITVSFPA